MVLLLQFAHNLCTLCSHLQLILECFCQIPLVADLPVGHNFQDHILCDGIIYTIDGDGITDPEELDSLTSQITYSLTGGGK